MTFIHGYLLAGLVLAGLPILVHLVMKQKPQQLSFAAFRFLKRRLHVNRRRMRLQHLLLLALRVGVLAALCLALVRPRIENSGLGGNSDTPVAAVFLFDTRPGMEYVVNGESRLKTARAQAEALLADMAEGSRVAVLDSGDDPEASADRAATLTQARARVKALTTRPAAHPVNAHLARAYRVLNSLTVEDAAAPRLLYVFSNRTLPSWSASIKAEELPQGVRAVFVDVGVEEPHDLAIERIEVVPPVVEPGKPLEVQVTVRGTGTTWRKELGCQIDNDPTPEQPRFSNVMVELEAGKEKTYLFKCAAPPLPPKARTAAFQITARFGTPDALTFNDSRSATFLVRNRPTVLTIADDPKATDNWRDVFRAVEKGADRPLHKTFRCELLTTAAVNAWKANPDRPGDDPQLAHDIVCLYQTRSLSKEAWGRLEAYVNKGGNLIIVPGGDELKGDELKRFNTEGEKTGLLPATLVKLIDAPKDKPTKLKPFDTVRHEFTKPFAAWQSAGEGDFNKKKYQPFFLRYWEVAPVDKKAVSVLLFYADDKTRPALLEREAGRGRVMMFTTPLDLRKFDALRYWNNIWNESSFGLVLVDQLCLYLAGGADDGEVNFVCGKPVLTALLTRGGEKQYLLKGPPGLTLSETKVPAPEDRLLAVPQATQPGNYTVAGEGGETAAAFSVNIAPEESRLERVPEADVEAALGAEALLPPGQAPRLQDALKGGRAGQIELLPWLLMVVLLVLGVESVLANKFYKREPKTPQSAAPTLPPSAAVEPGQPLTAGTVARSG